jgi:3-phosphoshikimate 1-carboxyvinyltransferase
VSDRSIQPVPGPLSAVVEAPPSKSATHRALVAAALATGSSTIERPLEADDTRITLQALADLGFEVAATPSGWEVAGLGGTVPGGGEIALGESGTSFRFVTAVASLGQRPSRLDGAPRLRERPVHDLASVLERLGATLKLTGGGGGLPLEAGGSPVRGGVVSVSASHSSQFASALLLIGPRLDGGLELNLAPGAVSLPYIELTARVMREFGVEVERPDSLSWRVPAGDYAGRRYEIEGDHSSASYFLAAAAIVGGTVRVERLDPESEQADACLGEILETLGCSVKRDRFAIEVEGSGRIPPFDLEMSHAPDVVPTLAVLALFADGPCSMRGIAHLRIKESDRLGVLASNLRRLGREAEATEDALLVDAPGGPLHGATIETASDHRMAMAFAVAGLRIEGVVIDDPACVSKSNAGFWEDFSRIRTGS